MTTREVVLPDGSRRLRAVAPESQEERWRKEEAARDELERALHHYQQSVKDLELQRSAVEQANIAEELALHDPALTDAEIGAKASGAQRARNVYAEIHTATSEALTALEYSLHDFHRRYTSFHISEMERVRSIIRGAIVQAAKWSLNSFPPMARSALESVTQYAAPVIALGALAPSPLCPLKGHPGYWIQGDPECSIRIAKDLLEKFGRLRELEANV
jgi:hypothetical protein